MLRYADRTTILLCVCPSGQKKVRKPFAGVDVISLWVGRELALVCNSSGWRIVGEEIRWWVRRPIVGEETRWWVLPQAMPGQLLLLLQRWSEPATILTPILTSPYLPA